MKKNYIIILLVSSCMLFMQSCLDEKPFDVATIDILDDSDKSAQQLVHGVLGTLNQGDYFQYGSYMKGIEFDSDYLAAGTWALGGYGAGNFTYPGEISWIDGMWTGRYAIIYRCNKAIAMINKMNNVEADKKGNYLGQMYFLRAWAYSQLVRTYGPCPIHYQISTDPAGFVKPRASVEDVYKHIIENLEEADKLLFAKTDSRYELGRISKYAAKTLLAQVYVTIASSAMPEGTIVKVSGGPAVRWEGDQKIRIANPVKLSHAKTKLEGYEFADPKEYYQKAKDLCEDIITNGGYALNAEYMDTWKVASRNGSEFIWQLQASNSTSGLQNHVSIDFSGAFTREQKHWLRPPLYGLRDHWYELFEPEDARVREGVVHRYAEGLWTWGADGSDPRIGFDSWVYYPEKDSTYVRKQEKGYKRSAGKGGVLYPEAWSGGFSILRKFEAVEDRTKAPNDYFYPFLRYPVVYLMLAEAENELADNEANRLKAKKAVDIVRLRSKATAIETQPLNQIDLRSFILEERSRELAMEGYRKWDLLRWGVYVQVMNAIDVDEHNNVKRRQEKHKLVPLPMDEINSNPAAKQNFGW